MGESKRSRDTWQRFRKCLLNSRQDLYIFIHVVTRLLMHTHMYSAYAAIQTYPYVRRTFYANTTSTPTSFSNQTFIFYYGKYPTSQYPDFPMSNRIPLDIHNTSPEWPMARDTDIIAAFQLHTNSAATNSGPFCVQDAGVAVSAAAYLNVLPIRSHAQKTELLLNSTVAKPVVNK